MPNLKKLAKGATKVATKVAKRAGRELGLVRKAPKSTTYRKTAFTETGPRSGDLQWKKARELATRRFYARIDGNLEEAQRLKEKLGEMGPGYSATKPGIPRNWRNLDRQGR